MFFKFLRKINLKKSPQIQILDPRDGPKDERPHTEVLQNGGTGNSKTHVLPARQHRDGNQQER